MNKLMLLTTLFFLSACAALHSNNPDSEFFDIPKGSTLSLNDKLDIPHNDTHAVIQYGKEIADKDRHNYDVNCRLNFKKFGPRTIEPEDFKVSRTEDGENWISQASSILRYYTEIYLTSDKGTDIIKMVCQQYGDPSDYHFTVNEIEKTLGNYLSFTFLEKTDSGK